MRFLIFSNIQNYSFLPGRAIAYLLKSLTFLIISLPHLPPQALPDPMEQRQAGADVAAAPSFSPDKIAAKRLPFPF
jgi:hypothetical protein